MLMKNIPGLQFKTEELRILYETSPENITEDMVRKVVGTCKAMRYGRQEDSMELVMTMIGDLRNKEKLSINGGIKFFLERNNRCLPLLSYIDDSHKIRTGPGWMSESIRITNIQEKRYQTVQEAMEQLGFDGRGSEYRFSDSWDFFSENDYIEEDGNPVTLRNIHEETGSWSIPVCTKWVYNPESEYLIVDLSTVDIPNRRKIKAEFEDITRTLTFTTGGYTPISFVTHIGELSYGHYINYSLIDGVWYEFNDQTVSRLTDKPEYYGTPYYVLYRRF